jgi:hypothetical protein
MGPECNILSQGVGQRTCKIIVTYEKEFRNVPQIFLSHSLLDISGSSIRVTVSPADVTKLGFSIKLNTWADSIVWNSKVSWVAVGN